MIFSAPDIAIALAEAGRIRGRSRGVGVFHTGELHSIASHVLDNERLRETFATVPLDIEYVALDEGGKQQTTAGT